METNSAAEGKLGLGREEEPLWMVGLQLSKVPRAYGNEKDPASLLQAVVDGPAHCLYLALIQATSRWVFHPRALSSGLLMPLEVKPAGLTSPREGAFSCRSRASKACLRDRWFYLGQEGQERSSMPRNGEGPWSGRK